MTTYSVQFELPVDNPVSNVRRLRKKGRDTFFVPINHPDAHNMGYQDLLAAAELSGQFTVCPDLNKKIDSKKEK